MAISPLPAHGASWDTWAADIDAAVRAGVGGSSGGNGTSVTDNGDGTASTASISVVDHGDGTAAA